MKKSTHKFGFKLLLFLSLFTVINICFTLLYSHKVYSFFKNQEHGADLNAAIVFFEGMDTEEKLSEPTIRRLNVAIDLHKKKALNIICVGGYRQNKKTTGSEVMHNYLIKLGIPEDQVIYDTTSFDTFTNLKNGLEIATYNNWDSICLVSSPLHLYRIHHFADYEGYVGLKTYLEEYKQERPLLKKWLDVQHEFVAWIAYGLLPKKTYKNSVYKIRKKLQ